VPAWTGQRPRIASRDAGGKGRCRPRTIVKKIGELPSGGGEKGEAREENLSRPQPLRVETEAGGKVYFKRNRSGGSEVTGGGCVGASFWVPMTALQGKTQWWLCADVRGGSGGAKRKTSPRR